MAYVKWVGNADRHNDWTSELTLADGTVVKQNVPVDLKAEVQKELEQAGRIFESSSKSELDEYESSEQVIQPPGNDVLGTAPVFANAGASSQNTVVQVPGPEAADQAETVPSGPAKPAARSGSSS